MKLTAAQAQRVNQIMGVDFVDLDYEEDIQHYIYALEDGECLGSLFPSTPAGEDEDEVSEEDAAVQAASEEAHHYLTQLLNRTGTGQPYK